MPLSVQQFCLRIFGGAGRAQTQGLVSGQQQSVPVCFWEPLPEYQGDFVECKITIISKDLSENTGQALQAHSLLHRLAQTGAHSGLNISGMLCSHSLIYDQS